MTQGEFINDWKPTNLENPDFKCRICNNNNVWYRKWESSCGGYEDIQYDCRNCGQNWWVESSDA